MNEIFSSARAAEAWINGARWKGEKNGLENTRALLDALGNPEKRMGRILHVAGTNGKGSTCAYLDAALRSCGYKVGLFTSPYLRFFNERISFDASPIPDSELVSVASEVRAAAEELAQKGICCTTFELLTACACVYYAKMGADFSVMEVGMGGRLDSTNVLPSSVSLIAAIGMDHMARLGNTVEEIAGEKAGIMKPGVPCAVMPNPESVMEVFRAKARETGAPLYECASARITEYTACGCGFECVLPVSGRISQTVSVPGAHQANNACLALTALDLLGIDMAAAREGVAKAVWAGRLDRRGNVLVDCAHNPQGALALKQYADEFLKGKHRVLVTGMMQDKQIEACSAIFKTFADEVICTAVDWPRAMKPEALAQMYPGAETAPSVKQALARAREKAGQDGVIICAGSVYIAGDAINALEE